MKTCSVEGCEKPLRARGWCATHWSRWRRSGSPTAPYKNNRYVPIADRFWMKVEKGPDCWNWTGSIVTSGYGSIMERVDGRNRPHMAHRFAYELLIGPIREGMQVDHRCSNRKCVNPDHLRLATHKQNMENLTGARINSRTGVRGVYPAPNGRYAATVGHNGKIIWCGRFDTLEEATAVVTKTRLQLFTHNDADRMVTP